MMCHPFFSHSKQYFTDSSTDGQTSPAPSQLHQHVRWGWLSFRAAETLARRSLFLLWKAYADGRNKSWNPAMNTQQQATSPALMSGGWDLGDGGFCCPQVLTNTEKDTCECVVNLFWNRSPLVHSVAVTQGALAVCRISLAQTEESFVPLSLDPGRQTSELSECPAW